MRVFQSDFEDPAYYLDTHLVELPTMEQVARIADSWASLFLEWRDSDSASLAPLTKILCRRQNDYLVVEIASPANTDESPAHRLRTVLNEFRYGLAEDRAHLDTLPDGFDVSSHIWAAMQGVDSGRFAVIPQQPDTHSPLLMDHIVTFHKRIQDAIDSAEWVCITNRMGWPDEPVNDSLQVDLPRNIEAPSIGISRPGIRRVRQATGSGTEFGVLAHWGHISSLGDLYARVVTCWALTAKSGSLPLSLPTGTAGTGYGFHAQPLLVGGTALFTLGGTADKKAAADYSASTYRSTVDLLGNLRFSADEIESAKASLAMVFQSAWEDPRGRHGVLATTQMALGHPVALNLLLSALDSVSTASVTRSLRELASDSAVVVVTIPGLARKGE